MNALSLLVVASRLSALVTGQGKAAFHLQLVSTRQSGHCRLPKNSLGSETIVALSLLGGKDDSFVQFTELSGKKTSLPTGNALYEEEFGGGRLEWRCESSKMGVAVVDVFMRYRQLNGIECVCPPRSPCHWEPTLLQLFTSATCTFTTLLLPIFQTTVRNRAEMLGIPPPFSPTFPGNLSILANSTLIFTCPREGRVLGLNGESQAELTWRCPDDADIGKCEFRQRPSNSADRDAASTPIDPDTLTRQDLQCGKPCRTVYNGLAGDGEVKKLPTDVEILYTAVVECESGSYCEQGGVYKLRRSCEAVCGANGEWSDQRFEEAHPICFRSSHIKNCRG